MSSRILVVDDGQIVEAHGGKIGVSEGRWGGVACAVRTTHHRAHSARYGEIRGVAP